MDLRVHAPIKDHVEAATRADALDAASRQNRVMESFETPFCIRLTSFHRLLPASDVRPRGLVSMTFR